MKKKKHYPDANVISSKVQSVYKEHSREPENLPFMYRLILYALFINGKN
jgi:hypothetical protein